MSDMGDIENVLNNMRTDGIEPGSYRHGLYNGMLLVASISTGADFDPLETADIDGRYAKLNLLTN